MESPVKTLLIIVLLIAIVWSLGAGLYFLLTDRGHGTRTVRALSWRIGLSLVLFALIAAGIASGWIRPHGVGG